MSRRSTPTAARRPLKAQALIAGDLSVRWDLLADAAKGPLVWKAIARQMGPQALRMNLNTLLRHEVFGNGKADHAMVDYVADRIADAEEIRRSRQFPYQYLAAYLNAAAEVPQKIKAALAKAAEIACGNVPELPGPVVIGLDMSGSMGRRSRATAAAVRRRKMRCVDVAALFAAAVLRRNPDSVVVPFDTAAYEARVDPQDSILSLAERLAKYGGGGTDCSLPLREANAALPQAAVCGRACWSATRRAGSTAVRRGRRPTAATGVMTQWQEFVENQRKLAGREAAAPKLVCIDLQPYQTMQAPERDDILNVGGFSDAVFNVVASFLAGDAGRFVPEVESIEL